MSQKPRKPRKPKKSDIQKIKFTTLDSQYEEFSDFLARVQYDMIKEKLNLTNLPDSQEQPGIHKLNAEDTFEDFIFLKKDE